MQTSFILPMIPFNIKKFKVESWRAVNIEDKNLFCYIYAWEGQKKFDSAVCCMYYMAAKKFRICTLRHTRLFSHYYFGQQRTAICSFIFIFKSQTFQNKDCVRIQTVFHTLATYSKNTLIKINSSQ